jgi:hypothetical protein
MKRLSSILSTTFIALTFLLVIPACNKETSFTTYDVINNMIVNKTWYLDYAITGTATQNFVGQSTYFITFLKDGTTKDSDGLTGVYSIINNNGSYSLKVNAKTMNGNSLSYTHALESVGDVKMVQSYTATGKTVKTVLYFTSK